MAAFQFLIRVDEASRSPAEMVVTELPQDCRSAAILANALGEPSSGLAHGWSRLEDNYRISNGFRLGSREVQRDSCVFRCEDVRIPSQW